MLLYLNIEFLQYCLNDSMSMPKSAKDIKWDDLLLWAEKQAIVGVLFNGIQKAGPALKVPTAILLKWIGYANLIEGQNRLLNKRCVELSEYLGQSRFYSCILKGQGNALMYPNPLWRTPGDIDAWVMHGERLKVNGSRLTIKKVIRLAREHNLGAKACYHHVDYGEFNGVEVELHYRPSFMFNPVHNYRLQNWFCKKADGGCMMAELPEGAGTIRIPNKEFNIVFQLSHVYNHLLHEGIGLRQIIDYFYLLCSEDKLRILRPEGLSVACNDNGQLTILLRHLGLYKIAGAMMWVLNEVLGLPEEYLIAPKDEKRGKVLISEIMKGGNFGHYDAENQKANNAIKKNLQRIKRDMRMMRYFPSECLWEPVFRVYHFFWRLRHK